MTLKTIDLDALLAVSGGQNLNDALAQAETCNTLATHLKAKETALGIPEATRNQNYTTRVSRCGDAALTGLLTARPPQ